MCDSSQLLMSALNGSKSSSGIHSRNQSSSTTNINSLNINLFEKSGIGNSTATPTKSFTNPLNLNLLKNRSSNTFASKKVNALKDIIQY